MRAVDGVDDTIQYYGDSLDLTARACATRTPTSKCSQPGVLFWLLHAN